ncbi:aminotransferase class V-fold PLP-dependent enzyme [Myxococcus llanfairpwllgwyngyllgogerychwyrndrobwllllantysiliogogogochensis]|uniref:Aminotransferase class V-fold PLP-dependent enzyme n=1 Tax=Myxococcus llanfairpwllgwyngyllgogerychwyrndrobwllllantysiliogogogochensis TaxID=2590453 RepID=A0A540WWB4_9BACT|nr:aminotransferase class V-fold PLP-dependent enzyme [Myxococcus llanfairpwllgwyngyllgogerychwyrndrobwllllantysiliogogogochensis]TQF13301.1 aminotransferase class V-fold PLP-dependent enzyme [Myxococcus llanfairpwllgwyngyllgogerychwyrndrobwllllantysiliogogogochensis]
MNSTAKQSCKTVSDRKWTLSTFMEFYERVLGPKLFKPYGELLVREIRKDIRPEAPVTSILEVACGTGRITTHLYEELARPLNLKLVATDLSKIAIEVCKTVVGDDLNRDVEFHADVDMADLPFSNDSFDIIVCGFGLMFPPDKSKVAREFKRVLRPGGKIYGTVFHYNELFGLTLEQTQKLFGAPSAILDGALSLSDHSAITSAFSMEGLARGVAEVVTSCPLTFHLDEQDTREFLFNTCVLLEEFNQCDTLTREAYLDTILGELRAHVPSQNYAVNAWLLRGAVDEASKQTVAVSALPDFGELSAFRAMAPELVESRDDRLLPLSDAPALRRYQAMKSAFLAEHPEYPDDEVEALRREEFSRLDAQRVTYLDHVGGGIAPESLIEHDYQVLKNTILGNPHTGSKATEEAHEKARSEIYRFFRCSPEEYEIIFTPNASGAIRLVAESFPFESGSELLLAKDNHTSIHGIREFARSKGASVKYVPLNKELLLLESSLERMLEKLDRNHAHLFAFPAQSNATGAKHDLKWIKRAQERGAMVLCDAAAFVPLSAFDFETYQPDFVPVSLYKIFGYPTGAGCLIAKRASLRKLTPPSFAGGAVCYYSGPWSTTDRMLHHDQGRQFEIGTPNYASFHAIAYGFEFISRLGVGHIGGRANALARWLETQLQSLRHEIKAKGPLCRVYGPAPEDKGATVMMNVFDCYNAVFPHAQVKRAAESFGITLRNGCFCNLGAVQHATYSTAGSEHCELDKKRKILDCKTFDEEVLTKGLCGAVRVSFGLGSNFRDAYRFYLFAKSLMNTETSRLEDHLAAAS